MRGRYIDFISSYCDGWCERCAFTDRCSVYAVQAALGMCEGDVDAALELAVGTPPPRNAIEAKRRERRIEEMNSTLPSEREMEELQREEDARDERIDESPLTTASERVRLLGRRWLDSYAEELSKQAGPALAEALEIACRDCLFIRVKLRRALRGRDEREHGRRRGHRIQNDWNGSAKVTLLSIDRSLNAWDLIAAATGDADAAHVAAELRTLQREVESAFPNARKFQRPGFDDPPGGRPTGRRRR